MLLRKILLATAVLVGILLIGCGSSDDSAPAPGAQAPAANGRQPGSDAAEGGAGAPASSDDAGK